MILDLKDFLVLTIDKLEKEFERVLEKGLDDESPIYEYLNDIRVGVNKIE